MKKLLIPVFVCTAAMLIACGDDSSSASSESVESSSSVAADSSSGGSVHIIVPNNDGHNEIVCTLASDTTTYLKYSLEGPDSALIVTNHVYPRVNEDPEKVCEEVKAEKTAEQEVICEPTRVEIIYPAKTMTLDSLAALAKKECLDGTILSSI